MALGLTQPVTEVSSGSISWVKGGRCLELATLASICGHFIEILGDSTA